MIGTQLNVNEVSPIWVFWGKGRCCVFCFKLGFLPLLCVHVFMWVTFLVLMVLGIDIVMRKNNKGTFYIHMQANPYGRPTKNNHFFILIFWNLYYPITNLHAQIHFHIVVMFISSKMSILMLWLKMLSEV